MVGVSVCSCQVRPGCCNAMATALQWGPLGLGHQPGPGGTMRARYPDAEGFVDRGGVKVGYEVFGEGEPAVVLAPLDPIVHSRAWKAQVPYLARRFRVITVDPRGNGRSDRPRAAAAYAQTEFVADTVAVMDACEVERAVMVGVSSSGWTSLLVAAVHPERVLGVVAIA